MYEEDKADKIVGCTKCATDITNVAGCKAEKAAWGATGFVKDLACNTGYSADKL